MRSLSALSLVGLLVAGPALAQGPNYGLGRTPTSEEVRAWDISIHPITGAELPPGQGTAVEGALVYRRSCARCHGAILRDVQIAHRARELRQRIDCGVNRIRRKLTCYEDAMSEPDRHTQLLENRILRRPLELGCEQTHGIGTNIDRSRS